MQVAGLVRRSEVPATCSRGDAGRWFGVGQPRPGDNRLWLIASAALVHVTVLNENNECFVVKLLCACCW
jgi:hypothetical protein